MARIELAERWSAHYGWAGVLLSRLLPVIRHLIGIPAGILRLDFRWYSAATAAGSLLWCSVLAWLGMTVGSHPELLKGSLHRFAGLVMGVGAVLAALYYWFVYPAYRAPVEAVLRCATALLGRRGCRTGAGQTPARVRPVTWFRWGTCQRLRPSPD